MTRSIVRVVLSTLAVVVMFAGSFNLDRSWAQDEGFQPEAAPSKCQEIAGCPGGSTLCGTIILPDSTTVRCGMP